MRNGRGLHLERLARAFRESRYTWQGFIAAIGIAWPDLIMPVRVARVKDGR